MKKFQLISEANPWPRATLIQYFELMKSSEDGNKKSKISLLQQEGVGRPFLVNRTCFLTNKVTNHLMPASQILALMDEFPHDDIVFFPSHFESVEKSNEWFQTKCI